MMLCGYQPPPWALLPSWDQGIPSRSVALSRDGAPRNRLNTGAFGSQPRNGAADCSGVQPSLLLDCGSCCHPCTDHLHSASSQGQRATSGPRASHWREEGTQPLGREGGRGSGKEPGKGRGDEERDAVLEVAGQGCQRGCRLCMRTVPCGTVPSVPSVPLDTAAICWQDPILLRS